MKKLSFLMMCFAFSVNASAQVNVSVDKDVATIEIKGEAGQLYAKSCARAQISLADALGSATTIQLTGGGNVNDADVHVLMNAISEKSADINLDMAGVYIDKISTAMNIGGWSDGGSSTFAKGADSWYVWQPISNIKRFVFPEISGDNKNVPNHALHTFSNVEEIVVPASYSTLDARAFAGREKLVSITIGEEGIDGSLAYVGEGCFENCTSLSSVDFVNHNPNVELEFGKAAFMALPKLKSIVLPEGLTVIGESCFKFENKGFAPALSSITLPSTLKRIEAYAFNGLQEVMTSIVFPAGIEYIGESAFGLTRIKDVYFTGIVPPVVAPDAFDKTTYYGENGFEPGADGDIARGVASRENYHKENGYFGMLHLRPELLKQEEPYITYRKAFTDITRDYSLQDKYVGTDLMWPTHAEFGNAYNQAENGYLDDGVTTYEADKYEGLHKFVLVAYDANQNSTLDWEFGSITGGKWWTLCVPFNMTKEQVETAFGEGTEVCMFSDVVRDEVNRKLILKFKEEVCQVSDKGADDIVIEAHVSYMIHPTNDKPATSSLKFSNYQVVDGSPIPTTLYPASDVDNEHGYMFVGNYSSLPVSKSVKNFVTMEQYSYFLSKSSVDGPHKFFFRLDNTGRWNPYTSVVQTTKGAADHSAFFGGNTSSSKAMGSLFGTEDDATTGIDDVEIIAGNDNSDTNSPVYNICGQLVGAHNSNVSNLSKGLYIVNGKKIIVK
ncbi:MAG: leucine-rich repeat domain-containing protein [Prevotella sp.]|nr:leucine-rich repeat domain-containing protein [Prevotella sp.]